jgi:hypothetical protein
MIAMPTRTDESPPRQQDRAPEDGRVPRDEARNADTEAVEPSGDHDTGVSGMYDQDINTHGSER